jgi:hypothetical protein
MSKFMVRMLLHDAQNWGQYDELHKAMEERGFSRTLVGSKATYHLPPAEYWFKGDEALADVRVLAAAAAETTGQPFGMVVVKVDGWSVMRLKSVDTPSRGDGDTKLKPRGRRG